MGDPEGDDEALTASSIIDGDVIVVVWRRDPSSPTALPSPDLAIHADDVRCHPARDGNLPRQAQVSDPHCNNLAGGGSVKTQASCRICHGDAAVGLLLSPCR